MVIDGHLSCDQSIVIFIVFWDIHHGLLFYSIGCVLILFYFIFFPSTYMLYMKLSPNDTHISMYLVLVLYGLYYLKPKAMEQVY